MSSKFTELARAVEAIGAALRAIDAERLDAAEKNPVWEFDRLCIRKPGWETSRLPASERAVITAMENAGRSSAMAMGKIARADQLEQALKVIHTNRAILCSIAAAAVVELAGIARDAQERG